MPVIGWYLGTTFRSYIEKYDAWIAFILLACIGGKMIIETYSKKGDDERSTTDIRNLLPLTMLAIATSIDALAVGISFSVLKQGIWIPAAIIGGVTFAVCLAGFEFGKKLGHLFEKKAQVVGGLVLIGIGIKILIEDLIGS
ncbi:hypothetical protein FACS1894172_19710 [Spirochaetia bacterium]|nr:hypothetical protein FACS1894172_19710 [Spirochaetia bacterium]